MYMSRTVYVGIVLLCIRPTAAGSLRMYAGWACRRTRFTASLIETDIGRVFSLLAHSIPSHLTPIPSHHSIPSHLLFSHISRRLIAIFSIARASTSPLLYHYQFLLLILMAVFTTPICYPIMPPRFSSPSPSLRLYILSLLLPNPCHDSSSTLCLVADSPCTFVYFASPFHFRLHLTIPPRPFLVAVARVAASI